MKIKEVVERNCCHPDDLVKIKDKVRCCQHCGSFWVFRRNLGEMDAGWEKVSDEEYKNILRNKTGP